MVYGVYGTSIAHDNIFGCVIQYGHNNESRHDKTCLWGFRLLSQRKYLET